MVVHLTPQNCREAEVVRGILGSVHAQHLHPFSLRHSGRLAAIPGATDQHLGACTGWAVQRWRWGSGPLLQPRSLLASASAPAARPWCAAAGSSTPGPLHACACTMPEAPKGVQHPPRLPVSAQILLCLQAAKLAEAERHRDEEGRARAAQAGMARRGASKCILLAKHPSTGTIQPPHQQARQNLKSGIVASFPAALSPPRCTLPHTAASPVLLLLVLRFRLSLAHPLRNPSSIRAHPDTAGETALPAAS